MTARKKLILEPVKYIMPTCKVVTHHIQTKVGRSLTKVGCDRRVVMGEIIIPQDNKLSELENGNVHG